MKEIEKKTEDSIKVKPKFHFIASDEYEEKIKTLVASGKKIDAFLCNGAYQFENYTKDITDLFPKYAPNYYRELKSNKMGEESLYNSSINGKIYSVPCNAFNCPRYFIVARKDLVDKYANGGFETLEDYGDFLKSVKENEPDLIPGAVYSRTFF